MDISQMLEHMRMKLTRVIIFFPFVYKSSERVVKIIDKIKPKTSSGPDVQSSKLLKAVGNTLSPTLSIILNQALYSEYFQID